MAERFKYLANTDLTLTAIWAWAKQLVQELNKTAVDLSKTAGVPTGATMFWHSADLPEGWVLCDGTSYTRAQYPVLFVAIGYSFGGAGDSFNVPDYRNRLFMGAGTTVALNELKGADQVTLSVDTLPAHNHTVNDPGHTHVFTGAPHNHAVTDPGHSHPAAAGNFVQDGAGTAYGAGAVGSTAAATGSATTGIATQAATATGTNANAQTGVTIANKGGGQPFSILPPVVGQNIMMKV